MNVGIDEAGKGCIFGPVYASAVIWDNDIDHTYLKDSKKLSKKKREELFYFIQDNAIDYGIGYSSNTEIDAMGISSANTLAMHRALDNINLDFDHILVDGIVFKQYSNKSYSTIIGGDSKYKSIMAASILAKVSHDKHLENIINEYPDYEKYGLNTNMGYGTAKHINAVKEYGRSEYHRYSFKLPFEKFSNCLL